MKKNSWHYKLAKMGNNGNTIWSEEYSICQYTRKVMFGALLFTFMCLMGGFLISWVGIALYEIVGAIFGFAVLGPAAATFMGFTGAIGLIALYGLIKDRWQEKSRVLLKKDNNSFVASAYKSYKDKICFPVKFEE